MAKNRAIFLDRDGVLNRTIIVNGKPFAPKTLDNFELLPEALPALSILKNSGFKLIVVTNQPDVGNGLVKKSTVERMHLKLLEELPIDDIFVCFHSQQENCLCRKPHIGMLIVAAKQHNIDLENSYMIGDRCSDILAGKAAHCFSIFIDRKYKEPPPDNPDSVAFNVLAASKIVIKNISKIKSPI